MIQSRKMIFAVLFFLWNLLYFLQVLIHGYFADLTIRPFDDALKLLVSLYTSNGFIPYNDFAFVYPPGQIILNSLIQTDVQLEFKLLALSALLLSLPPVVYILYTTRSLYYAGIVVLLLTINLNIPANPYSETLWITLVVFLFAYAANPGKRMLAALFLISFFLFTLRWDRIIFLTVLFSASLLINSFFQKKKNLINQTSLQKLTGMFLFSSIMGLYFIAAYLLILGINLDKASYFIFAVPFKIAAFRALPLFSSDVLSHGKIIYFFLLMLVPLILKFINRTKSQKLQLPDLLAVILPLSVLPNSLGRIDIPHALPLITALTLVYSYYALKNEIFFKIGLFLMILYIFHTFQLFILPNQKSHGPYDSQIQQCKYKVKNLKYNSLFVGRNSYSHFVISYSNLYLVDPSKKPASSYISDEPGLQNTCEDGKIISQELTSSQKPILAFIETSKQKKEPNLSSSMKSCEFIENWLKSHEFEKLDECRVENAEFEIRLYK